MPHFCEVVFTITNKTNGFSLVFYGMTVQLDQYFDPVSRGGFTQVPNFILKDPNLSIGAKLTYSMFLSYAWNNDSCFPGQERLGEGTSE